MKIRSHSRSVKLSSWPLWGTTNDSLVLSVLGKEIGNEVIPRDQRGRHTPANKLDMQPVYDHIESFLPSVSHYRREHAPHCRYLPSDINIKLMYADYLEKGNSCSYESHRKAVKHKNISFTKLGEEECEECLLQDQHMKNYHNGDGHVMDCLQCQRWRAHKESAMQSRIIYQADAEKDWPEDTLVKSVDLQKVIMLPRMPGLKTTIFTKRIVAFHETFASVGKKKNKKTPSRWSGMRARLDEAQQRSPRPM
ncbi:sorting nexin [Labeo rohita]|uniref:Sorting nexin n=1 Tax=Labeo rohita TaxID=84645 RepID=A0A498NIG4_LABRO|nr:sorting nexin [Labeo rohita]RXN31589.1 sorting nexin [Labeo rohita]